MSTQDVFGMTDRLDPDLLAVIARRLEARGQHPFFMKMAQDYLTAVEIDTAQTVLDLGCGTGILARAIGRREGFKGKAIGVDLSPYLINTAANLANQEGISDRLSFQTGDCHHLEFADSTFDAVIAHTLLSHVRDPAAVIQEAARVVKPGGRLGFFDGDYASLTFDQEDPEKGKADDEAIIKALVTNPRVMRQMPRLLRKANLELITYFPYVFAEAGKADFWASSIEAYRKLVTNAKTMTEDYAEKWAAERSRDSEEDIFFGASNYYAFVARKR